MRQKIMQIKTKFTLGIVSWLTVFVLCLGYVIYQESAIYQHNRQALYQVECLRLTMVAMERISAERGPGNAALAQNVPDKMITTLLSDARLRSDQALSQLALMDLGGLPLAQQTYLQQQMAGARARLLHARASIDAMLKRPLDRRSSQQVEQAIHDMFGVVDQLMPAMKWLAYQAGQENPSLSGAIFAAVDAVDLREQAGRVGSELVPLTFAGGDLTFQRLQGLQQTRGNITALWSNVQTKSMFCCNQPMIRQYLSLTDKKYFGEALPFLESVLQRKFDSGVMTLSGRDLIQIYVPYLGSIVQLRDALLQQVSNQAMAARQQAESRLWLVIALAMAFLLIVVLPSILLGRYCINALVYATHIIKALASGKTDTPIPPYEQADEAVDILNALTVLREHSQRRRELEVEREALIDDLELAANTDFLTGVSNRRAFRTRAEQLLASAAEKGQPCCIALLDIDHFKQINDKWGHDIGDKVLKTLSQKCAGSLRSHDIFARYGGEEFAICLANTPAEAGRHVLERLRLKLAAVSVQVNEHELFITVSIGVVVQADQRIALDKLLSEADKALYMAKLRGRNQVVLAGQDA